jgi:acylpyruvate hydrolase
MRLIACHTDRGLNPGLYRDGKVLPLSVGATWEESISALHRLQGVAPPAGEPLLATATLPAVPATDKTRILCVGVNYADHASEGKMDAPKFPNFFVRYLSSLVADGESIVKPKVSDAFDYEAELVIIIGKQARHVTRERALEHVFGYTVGMDGSVRDYQRRTSQFTMGKNFDRSGSLGPAIVTADELPPGGTGLKVQSWLNGKLMQDGNTADLIFDTAAIVSYLSEAMVLNPGDLIFTGTPSGVGFARQPPVFMKEGDVLEVSVEGIGKLTHKVVAER